MIKLTDLTQRIISTHIDPKTKASEVILLGYCDNDMAGEHISRYIFGSKFAHGVVLDCGAGSCYGSSILRRSKPVELVVSVDINKDILQYGKIVYNTENVCADATYLPFRHQAFNSIVSIEILEHIKDQKAFLNNIKLCLRDHGNLILSTPNKLYTSPFLPKPLNPYHMNEYYLGPLLTLLKSHGFKVSHIYGGKKMKIVELIGGIFRSLLKFLISKLYLKPYLIDNLYYWIYYKIGKKRKRITKFVDPVPFLFQHKELKVASNIVLYEYFVIRAHRI